MSYFAQTDIAIQKNEELKDVKNHPLGYAIIPIIKHIEEEFNTTFSTIKTKSFKRVVALPRMVLIYALIKKLRLGREEIGLLLNKDQSSTTYALRTISNLIETDSSFENRMSKIMNAL